mgnify:CR=1 FL=1|jgi:hypothetical protein
MVVYFFSWFSMMHESSKCTHQVKTRWNAPARAAGRTSANAFAGLLNIDSKIGEGFAAS